MVHGTAALVAHTLALWQHHIHRLRTEITPQTKNLVLVSKKCSKQIILKWTYSHYDLLYGISVAHILTLIRNKHVHNSVAHAIIYTVFQKKHPFILLVIS